MKRTSIIAIILSAALLTGCSTQSVETDAVEQIENTVTEAAETETETTTEATTEATTETTREYPAYEYTVDFHKASDLMYEYYGEHAINLARQAIDIFMEGGNSIVLTDFEPGDMHKVYACACMMDPVFDAFTERNSNFDYDINTNTLTWINHCTPEEALEHREEVEEITDEYLSKLREGDNELIRSAQIYYDFSYCHTYDYDFLNSSSELSIADNCYYGSSYYVLTSNKGICYSLSRALTFLYIQADINAIDVGSQGNENSSGAHAWVLANIDGKYYYMDSTWDLLNDSNSCSMMHYGMTIDDRIIEGGYQPTDTTIGLNTPISETDLDITDTRFINLHGYSFYDHITDFRVDRENGTVIVTDVNNVEYVIR